MTERTPQADAERDYVPGMGKHVLLPLYDVVHAVFGLRRMHQEMITAAGLSGGQRVLDVGCGTGNLLRSIGRRHRDIELVGLEPDPRALARAGRKARRAGLTIQLDRGFAQTMPYPDGSFDRVFSSLMLHHLDGPSKDELLAEVRRVLRPDGRLILADVVLDGHGHGIGHGRGHGHGHGGSSRRLHKWPGRMRELAKENVGDAVPRQIAAAGFTVEPTRPVVLRAVGTVGVEVARPCESARE